MPWPANHLPKYRKHRASGQAVVTIGGKDHYHGTKASKLLYDRLVSEYLSAGRMAPTSDDPEEDTVTRILAAYWKFCRTYYMKNGEQTKGGSSEITVRRCHFEHPGERAVNIGGSTGLAFFRPEPQGYEAKEITVEDCTFIGSAAPIAFVGVDGATVRYNTIYRPRRWVLRILPETQLPEFVASRNGRFANNVVAFRSDELSSAVNVGPHTAPETFVFSPQNTSIGPACMTWRET